MTPKERKRLNTLCKQIKDERDPRVFSILLKELDELLDATWSLPPSLPPKSKGEQREEMNSGKSTGTVIP